MGGQLKSVAKMKHVDRLGKTENEMHRQPENETLGQLRKSKW
jgi:hypothetical protein